MIVWTVLRGVGVVICVALALLLAIAGNALLAYGFCIDSDSGCVARVPGFVLFIVACLMFLSAQVVVVGLCLLRLNADLTAGLILGVIIGFVISSRIVYFVYWYTYSHEPLLSDPRTGATNFYHPGRLAAVLTQTVIPIAVVGGTFVVAVWVTVRRRGSRQASSSRR